MTSLICLSTRRRSIMSGIELVRKDYSERGLMPADSRTLQIFCLICSGKTPYPCLTVNGSPYKMGS